MAKKQINKSQQNINISKIKSKYSWYINLFLGIAVITLLVLGLLKLTIIGEFIDDFIFSFLFGWIKYIIYLICFMIIIPYCFRYQLKIKSNFLFEIILLIILLCWTTQTIYLLSINKNNVWTNYQNLNLVTLIKNYFSTWWTSTVIKNYNGFFINSNLYNNFNIQTILPQYATGGIISNILVGIFSYGYFVTNFIVNILVAIFILSLLLFNKPFIIFSKSYHALTSFKPIIINWKKEKNKKQKDKILKQKIKRNKIAQKLATKQEKILVAKEKKENKTQIKKIKCEGKTLKRILKTIKKNNNKKDDKPKNIKEPLLIPVVNKIQKYQEKPVENKDLKRNSEIIKINKELDIKQEKHKKEVVKNATNYDKKVENEDLKRNSEIIKINKESDIKQEKHKKEVVKNATNYDKKVEKEVQPSKLELKEKENPILSFIPKPIKVNSKYVLPKLEPITSNNNEKLNAINEENAKINKEKLISLFKQFNVKGEVRNYHIGSTITKYEVELTPGTRVNKITSLEQDIKLTLGSNLIRIEAPIPGKSMVGIEIPNKKIFPITIQDLMNNISEQNEKLKLIFPIGKNTMGKYIFHGLVETPHLLIAGSTGSGKSVFVTTLLISLLLHYKPHELKLVLIDPKWVELVVYNEIPHLLAPVINTAKKAPLALRVILMEMERRYQLLSQHSSRNIESYNNKINDISQKLPYYVVIIDELADLMVQNSKEIEEGIMRLTQMGRAAGIHLVIATQRPSTDIITGVIKNNIPSRIAFKVASWVDSKTIIDVAGAEKLLGKGDLLFLGTGISAPMRIQAPWISEEDVKKVIDFIKRQEPANYDSNFINIMDNLEKK